MKVLVDESLPQKIRFLISGHDVVTVRFLGWLGVHNGELVKRAEEHGIEVMVTGDQNLVYQQNSITRRLALVVLNDNHWPIIKQHAAAITIAVNAAVPGSFHIVDCGSFR